MDLTNNRYSSQHQNGINHEISMLYKKMVYAYQIGNHAIAKKIAEKIQAMGWADSRIKDVEYILNEV